MTEAADIIMEKVLPASILLFTSLPAVFGRFICTLLESRLLRIRFLAITFNAWTTILYIIGEVMPVSADGSDVARNKSFVEFLEKEGFL